ncbi:MAG TPA: choice-of-anchor L domain-containing protein [Flavobacteriales bacterium]|nr:choice-of-anchor L domain-containing protein [Flavobacteriales bacterium]
MRFRYVLFCSAALFSLPGQAQLVVDDTMTPAELVENVLLGGGVSISNITYNGVPVPGTPQDGSGSFTQVGDLGLDAGVILSTGFAASAIGPSDNFSTDDILNNGNDPDLEALVGGNITNYSILEFDFVPTGDSLKFRYVFSSEEYPGFVCSFNDAFGFFLSGPGIAGPYSGGAENIAVLPDLVTPVTINNVNNGLYNDPLDPTCPAVNPEFYVDNEEGQTIAFGGFTTVLTAFALVQCGALYHIKLAVADAGNEFDMDTAYDSAVFLEAGSFTSTGQVIPELVLGPGVIGNDMNEGCVPVELVFTRQGDLSAAETVDIIVGGTATPGVDYGPILPSQLDFAAEDSTVSFILDLPLDPDGPETLVITISQLIVCANTNVETVFTFDITSPPPLATVAADIEATCGDVNVLDPGITGGVGYYAYLWSTGETTPTISVSPEVSTTYEFTVTDSCSVEPLTGSFTVFLPYYAPLNIEASPALEIPCLGEDEISVTVLGGGNGSYSYAWTRGTASVGNTSTVSVPSPATPTWYVATVTEGCGDVAQDSVLVSMVPLDPIAISTSGNVTVICPGDTTVLSVTDVAGGNGVYTLEWTDIDGTVLGTASDLEVGVPVDASYTITVADQCGTVGEAEVATFLPHYEQFRLTMSEDHTICFGDSSVVEASVTGGSGYFFVDWVDRGWTDPILKVIPTEETTYQVNVTDQCGEVLSDAVTVSVEAVYMDITETNTGQDDWYLQAATVPLGVTHVWDMGDGTQYRRDEVVHSYTDLEEHWVTLRITTTNGCSGVDSVLLKPPAHIYFPNAFSPDGDGVNETFGPVGHYIDEFEMTIFDRWGEVMYTTDNTGKPWSGDVNGGDAATTGVYVYKYRATGHYFPAIEGYGHVTLLKGTQE